MQGECGVGEEAHPYADGFEPSQRGPCVVIGMPGVQNDFVQGLAQVRIQGRPFSQQGVEHALVRVGRKIALARGIKDPCVLSDPIQELGRLGMLSHSQHLTGSGQRDVQPGTRVALIDERGVHIEDDRRDGHDGIERRLRGGFDEHACSVGPAASLACRDH